MRAHLRRDTPHDVAQLIHESIQLDLPSGFVIAVPNPNPVPTHVIDQAIQVKKDYQSSVYNAAILHRNRFLLLLQQGLDEIKAKNISGQAVTPYLLKRLNEITGGVSLGSNIDLVKSNAVTGSHVSRAVHTVCFCNNKKHRENRLLECFM